MQGWRIRMEDAHIAQINQGKDRKLHIFGVFDGHGGKEVSQFVKAHFTQELINNKYYLLDDLSTALIQTFLLMDELMISPSGKEKLKQYSIISKKEDEKQDKEAKEGNNKKNNKLEYLAKMVEVKQQEENADIAMMVGCTACVCVIDENNKKIYVANAGDSRVVLCKQGKAYQMSIDHKPDLSYEKNRIYKGNGWVSEGRIKCNLNLSRSIGDLEYKQDSSLLPKDQIITAYPDIVIENYSQECNFIIIGCDGIWDCISNQEACDFVSERINTETLSDIINELMDSILSEDINNGI